MSEIHDIQIRSLDIKCNYVEFIKNETSSVLTFTVFCRHQCCTSFSIIEPYHHIINILKKSGRVVKQAVFVGNEYFQTRFGKEQLSGILYTANKDSVRIEVKLAITNMNHNQIISEKRLEETGFSCSNSLG